MQNFPTDENQQTLASLREQVRVLKNSLELGDPAKYWRIKRTKFGEILEGEEGDTMLPPGMWEEILKVIKSNKQGKPSC